MNNSSMMALYTGVIILVICISIWVIWQSSKVDKAMPKKEIYDDLLSELRENPNNAYLREKALMAGRDYYGTLRLDGRLTIYDEQAITNDINVAIGNGNPIEPHNNSNNVYKDIEQLANLKDKGILTEEEFNEKKRVLLEKIQ